MSIRKTVYQRSELFKIRETLGLDPLPGAPGATVDAPGLPLFRANSQAAQQLESSGGFGSWRDGGGFGSQGGAVRRVTSNSSALHASPSSSDLSATTSANAVQKDVQWVYRTKGRVNKSNPMSIKDIEQLVADELVDADEIELSRVCSTGPEHFVSYSEAQAAPATTIAIAQQASDVDTNANATHVERWRPGASGNAERRPPQRPPTGSAPSVSSGILERRAQQPQQQHNHLPPKHLSISRDDMLAADDLRRRSPCAVPHAVTPPSTSPTTATILPTPIDAGAIVLDESLGLGTVPTPNAGSSLHPFPPQPPCGLDIDQEAYAAVSPSGKRSTQTPSRSAHNDMTPTKLRPPPPPVLSVDEPAATSPTSEAPPVPAVMTAVVDTPLSAAELRESPAQPAAVPTPSQSPAKVDAKKEKKPARSPAKGPKKSPVTANAAVDASPAAPDAPPPASANAKKGGGKGKGERGSRGVTPAVSPTVPQQAPPPKAAYVDPAIVSQGPATFVAPAATVVASEAEPTNTKVDRKRDAKKAATVPAAPWSNNNSNSSDNQHSNKAASGKQQQQQPQSQRRSKQTSPAQPTPPAVDTSLYPTMDEILRGDVKVNKSAPRQVKTLASIVAEGGRGVAAATLSSPTVDGAANQSKQTTSTTATKKPPANRSKAAK